LPIFAPPSLYYDYNIGSFQQNVSKNAKDWQRVRGRGTILIEGLGEQSREIHWYQCKNIGKVEFKIKERG
jgi:hypothetical protein